MGLVHIIQKFPRTDRHYLAGTVSVGGVLSGGRLVAAFNRATLVPIGVTLSRGDGSWVIRGVESIPENDVLVVCVTGDSSLNAACADHVSQVVEP